MFFQGIHKQMTPATSVEANAARMAETAYNVNIR